VSELVAILLATYNGARFLEDQLNSIANQTYKNWILFASDDGSQDETVSILNRYRIRWGDNKLVIKHGPEKGFAMNFVTLLCSEDIHADFYAFADQDDVWHADKLHRALNTLKSVPQGVPALYGGRTLTLDERNEIIGSSPLFTKAPSFQNALVQSIMGGNTMVLNQSLKEKLKRVDYTVAALPSHDWWCYLVVTGLGGACIYDPQPSVSYRQHNHNIVGSNVGFMHRLRRFRRLLDGQLKLWTDAHLALLAPLRPLLSTKNKRTLEQLKVVRYNGAVSRLTALWKSGLHRQSVLQTLMLVFSVLIRKI
jgi:glycosyltransferase involved in cell wall biosynthesis